MDTEDQRDKQQWRAEILARRRDLDESVRAAEAAALVQGARRALGALIRPPAPDDRFDGAGSSASEAIARSADLTTSPGRAAMSDNVALSDDVAMADNVAMPEQSAAHDLYVCAYVPVRGEPGSVALLDELRFAGARVLLPVTGEPGPLDWAEYGGPDTLTPARYGLLEPTGARLSPAAVGWAEVVLVPALAVDRRGVRLGRGAGYYDRTLGAARPGARLVAVVRDDEVVARLPEQPHDLRMGWALTPRQGLLRLAG